MNLETPTERNDYLEAKALLQWLIDSGVLDKTAAEVEEMAVDYAFFCFVTRRNRK